MKDIEIEIQVRVEKVENLLNFLCKEGKFMVEEYQKDEYFTPAHRNFLEPEQVDEWLRLRKSSKNSVAYKLWHRNAQGKSTYCDEYETEVTDLESMRKIFGVLDIVPIAVVEKNRKMWLYKDWEFAIDLVSGLGDFVEIEYKGKKIVEPEQVIDDMISFLKKLDVGKIEINQVGYPFLALFGVENQFEEV